MERRNAKLNLYFICILFSIVPLVFTGLFMSVQSLYSLRSSIKSETELMLTVAGESLNARCAQDYEANGRLPDDEDYVKLLRSQHVDLAIYNGNKLVVKSSEHVPDALDSTVVETVLNSGETLFTNNLMFDGEEYYGYYSPVKVKDKVVGVVLACEPVSFLLEEMQTNFQRILVLCISLICLFTLTTTVLTRRITKPLKATADYVLQLSNKDLSIPISNTTSIIRETIDILEGVKTLHTSFKSLLVDTEKNVKELDRSANVAHESAATVNDNINKIGMAVSELSNAANNTAESVQSINVQMTEVGDSITEMHNVIESLNDKANQMLDVNKTTVSKFEQLIKDNDTTVSTIKDVSTSINNNYKLIQDITNAVDLITEIAEQTNLLSLNAAIEAARAGEAGRGFAVVADSIQTLSVQSNEGANSIRQLVTSILVQSVTSVDKAKEAVEFMESGRATLDETMQAFEELNQIINETTDNVTTLKSKADSLDSVKNEVLNSVQDLSAISEETAASSEEMAASTETIMEATKELANVVEDVNQAVIVTDKNIKEFNL